MWQSTTVGRSFRVFTKRDQRRIGLITVLQSFLSLLDLLGVALVGMLGALTVNGIQSREPGTRVSQLLEILNISSLTFQNQVAILGIASAIVFIFRTIASVLITRRILYFLSRRAAVVSSHLVSRLLSQNLLEVQSRTSQETLFAVTTGVNTITVGVVGTLVGLFSDASLLIVMCLGLIVVDPIIALSTFLLFGLIGFSLYWLMHHKAKVLGIANSEIAIKSNEKIIEVLRSYRESVVRNRRGYYAREIGISRLQLANNNAEMSFMPLISKYVIEASVIFGSLVICAVQFLQEDSTHAVATLAVFLAAGSRIAPAVLRVQQNAIQIKGSLGAANPTLELIEQLEQSDEVLENEEVIDFDHLGFSGEVCLKNVTFTYPGKTRPAAKEITFNIQPGESVALVGTSGAGKTTVVDLILGVLPPTSGSIEISGETPEMAIKTWPGAISYVPQDVMISNGTIRENVSLGYPLSEATDSRIWEALEVAQLEHFVQSLPGRLDSPVGEYGSRISGGQRQRLGIARAMFLKPKLLVLDEATSALDGQTELEITEAITGMKGNVTVITIAHRLSTVRNADIVVYLRNGVIQHVGKFDEVRNAVPDFEHQAKLMGL